MTISFYVNFKKNETHPQDLYFGFAVVFIAFALPLFSLALLAGFPLQSIRAYSRARKCSQFHIELVRFSLFFLLELTNSLLALISLNFNDAQHLTYGVIVKTENIL